jgi:hypothetical protein
MDTKKYFADRDLTIRAANGQRKKIIHYVSQHDRIVKGKEITIKEHLRGLNKFTWNGYDCVVTAPKFSKLNTVVFDLPPQMEEDVIDEKVKMVGMTKVVDLLVEQENFKWK